MRKILVICLAAVALLGAACGGDDDEADAPEGAQTYTVAVDANTDGDFQIAAYYPGHENRVLVARGASRFQKPEAAIDRS